MKKICLLLSLVFLASWFTGCTNAEYSQKILQNRKYLVGGGLFIDFIAPEDGTVIYADASSHKILVTKSILAGEKFEMNLMKRDDAEKILENYIELSKLNPQLYFIPGSVSVQQQKK